MAWGLVAGVGAAELSGADRAPSLATKVLHFPADQLVGKLSVEDPSLGSLYAELGRDLSYPFGFDPVRVCLAGDWDFVGLAQGDVVVPSDRNIQLRINLEPGPDDLSCLAKLGPSDLYKLNIESSIRRSSANRPGLESISHLTGLQILCLYQTGVTSRQMSSLKSLSSLRALKFTRELSFGSAGLAALKDFGALEYLDCDTGATDMGVKHLSQLPNLRWLRIRMGRIRGPGLAYLANMPRLERLCLWGTTGLTDQHIRYLEGLTRLKSLTLWGTDIPLTDASLASISKLTALEELHLIQVQTDFTDAGVGQLANMTRLRILGLGSHRIRDAGVLAGMGQLQSVGGVVLTSRNMKALAGLGDLKSLGLALEAPVRGSAGTPVAMLGELKSLEKLHVGYRHVHAKRFGDEELAFLESLSRLKDLSIPLGDLTERGWASIGKLRQLEFLSIGCEGKKNPVTKHGLNHLNKLTNLQTLDLFVFPGSTPAMDNTPLNLEALTNLKTIELTGLTLQESDLVFLTGQEHLEWLMLQNRDMLSENALRYIQDLHTLKRLYVAGLTCTDGNGLAYLGGLKKLEHITLIGRITDIALERLTGLTSLWGLDITTDVNIRPETVTRLKQIFPGVRTVNIKQSPRRW